MTALKFWSPTHVAGCTRFVCCSDMTTVRTIGYHENAVKTNRSGNRRMSVDSPPLRAHVSGVRRGSRYSRSRVTAGVASTSPTAPPTLRGRLRSRAPPTAIVLRAARDRALRGVVRRRQQRLDVGVLVGEDRLNDGVERVIHALRRGTRLGDERLLEDARRERVHLAQRQVDERLDPRVRKVVLLQVEEWQSRHADGLLVGGERLRIPDRLRLAHERLL